MKATISISQADIEQAIKNYVESQGFRVVGKVSLSHDMGDQREPGPGYSANMSVEPKGLAHGGGIHK